MNDKASLMRIIQKYDFVIKELNLYLDTHPTCRNALGKHRRYVELKKNAEAEYVRRFGPLCPEECQEKEYWTWIKNPYPWERS